MRRDTILVIGACGQIGAELTTALRQVYGDAHVIAADLKPAADPKSAAGLPGTAGGKAAGVLSTGPFERLDVLDKAALSALIDRYDVTQVYLLAAMLSATGERYPQQAWNLNMQGLLNTLDLAREKKLAKVFWPSSIAVFGPGAPRRNCPQQVSLEPTTVYGISKLAGENWCHYYFDKFGVDVRSIRYPGLISHQAMPGGGTTDYAVDIFHQALARKEYTCFLRPNTHLPMMYMPDALRATLELMDAPAADLSVRTSYNLSAMSFSPAQIATAIRQYIPDFTISYEPDFRQAIADSWPESIDDSRARSDWHWEYEYGLSAMTKDMLHHLSQKVLQTQELCLEQK
jgi:nucleoside-diphosphate-sugar epimerase